MPEGEECPVDPSHSGIYVNLLENPERFTGYGGWFFSLQLVVFIKPKSCDNGPLILPVAIFCRSLTVVTNLLLPVHMHFFVLCMLMDMFVCVLVWIARLFSRSIILYRTTLLLWTAFLLIVIKGFIF